METVSAEVSDSKADLIAQRRRARELGRSQIQFLQGANCRDKWSKGPELEDCNAAWHTAGGYDMNRMTRIAAALAGAALLALGTGAGAYGGVGGGGGHGGGGGGHGSGGHGGGYGGHGGWGGRGGWGGWGWHGHGYYGCCGWGLGYYDPLWDPWLWDDGLVDAPYAPVAPPVAASAPAAPSYWYYCRESRSYYPYVSQCASAWQPVPAAPRP